MFYLSERKIVKGLIAAHERGVKLRILLDPNKDAFGREKMAFLTGKWLQNCIKLVFRYAGVIPKASNVITKF